MRIKLESLEEEPAFRYPINAPPEKTWQTLLEAVRIQPQTQIITNDPKYMVLVWEVQSEDFKIDSKQIDIEKIKLDSNGKRKVKTLEKYPRGYSARVITWGTGSVLLCRSNILWANHPVINEETKELEEINGQQKRIASMIKKSLNLISSQELKD